MIKKPLYTFDDETSTGLDKVPVNAPVLIESTGRQIVLTDKTSIDGATTITQLLALTSQFIDTATSWTYSSKTTTYTAVAYDYIYADTTAAFTITLPITPNAQDKVTILDAIGNFETNNLTVARNGETIMGLAEDILLDVNNKEYRFIYTGTDWRVAQ